MLLILVLILLFTLQASKGLSLLEKLGLQKIKEMLRIVYCAPDMTMLKLKLDRLPVSESTVSVKIAGVESPGFKTVLCLFQVRVR